MEAWTMLKGNNVRRVMHVYIIYTRARVGIEKLRRPLAGPHTPLLRSEERIALGPDDRNSREEWIVLQKQTTRLRVLAVWRQAFPCRREGTGFV